MNVTMQYTRAVTKKMKEDILKIFFWTTILVQSIFIIFYGYSIYKNIERIHFLIIYSILALLSLVHFIYYLVTIHNENKKIVNRVKRIFRISKYFVNGTMVGVSTYEMIKYGSTDFNKVLLIVSGVSLLVQFAVELIRIFMERYIDLFSYSIRKDFKYLLAIPKAKEAKGNFYTMVDAPIGKLANKLEGKSQDKELTKNEQFVEDLREKFLEEINAETKERSDARAAEQKQEIKEHLEVIKKSVFKKKNK